VEADADGVGLAAGELSPPHANGNNTANRRIFRMTTSFHESPRAVKRCRAVKASRAVAWVGIVVNIGCVRRLFGVNVESHAVIGRRRRLARNSIASSNDGNVLRAKFARRRLTASFCTQILSVVG
jgi:hypothetical protein